MLLPYRKTVNRPQQEFLAKVLVDMLSELGVTNPGGVPGFGYALPSATVVVTKPPAPVAAPG